MGHPEVTENLLSGKLSLSSNFFVIQERLDFSCAMFGPDGGLVANAPHIPVHLGAMQETVQYQVHAFLGFAVYFFVVVFEKEP